MRKKYLFLLQKNRTNIRCYSLLHQCSSWTDLVSYVKQKVDVVYRVVLRFPPLKIILIRSIAIWDRMRYSISRDIHCLTLGHFSPLSIEQIMDVSIIFLCTIYSDLWVNRLYSDDTPPMACPLRQQPCCYRTNAWTVLFL